MRKSPLKMAGSKQRLLEPLLNIIHDVPDVYKDEKGCINYYVEPFLGSATVALNVNANELFLSDCNQDLVDVATCCLLYKQELINELEFIWDLELDNGQYNADKYYKYRDYIRENQAVFAPYEVEEFTQYVARFLYLNKFGFNGLIRYTKKTNKFNTPIGRPSSKINPKVPTIPIEQIMDYEFNGVVAIQQKSYVEQFNYFLNDEFRMKLHAKRPCVFYCDPPYVKANEVVSDVIVYGEGGFNAKDQEMLAQLAHEASLKGHIVIISNHRTEFTETIYKERYGAELIDMPNVNRSISCKGNDRKHLQEIVAVFKPSNI